jgi:hypothetical protein
MATGRDTLRPRRFSASPTCTAREMSLIDGASTCAADEMSFADGAVDLHQPTGGLQSRRGTTGQCYPRTMHRWSGYRSRWRDDRTRRRRLSGRRNDLTAPRGARSVRGAEVSSTSDGTIAPRESMGRTHRRADRTPSHVPPLVLARAADIPRNRPAGALRRGASTDRRAAPALSVTDRRGELTGRRDALIVTSTSAHRTTCGRESAPARRSLAPAGVHARTRRGSIQRAPRSQ